MREPCRYVIRVVSADRKMVGWLRHGPVIGSGPIVRFSSKKAAERALEEQVKPGLDEGDIAEVVPIARGRHA